MPFTTSVFVRQRSEALTTPSTTTVTRAETWTCAVTQPRPWGGVSLDGMGMVLTGPPVYMIVGRVEMIELILIVEVYVYRFKCD